MLGQLFRRATPPEATTNAQPVAGPAPLSVQGDEAAGALRQIAARYDVTDISPGEFSSMLQDLRQAGLISDSQYHELSLIRMDLDAAGVEADDSLDLLDFYAEKLEEAVDAGAGSLVETTNRRRDWLQKLALLQSTPDAPALDTLA